ncbi:MAG: hypothetical protein WDN44_02035 [Sphingomonas sp.]
MPLGFLGAKRFAATIWVDGAAPDAVVKERARGDGERHDRIPDGRKRLEAWRCWCRADVGHPAARVPRPPRILLREQRRAPRPRRSRELNRKPCTDEQPWFAQLGELVAVLDALGGRLHPQRPGEIGDRADDRARARPLSAGAG